MELAASAARPKKIIFIFFGTHSSTMLSYGLAEGPTGLRRLAVARCSIRAFPKIYAELTLSIQLFVTKSVGIADEIIKRIMTAIIKKYLLLNLFYF